MQFFVTVEVTRQGPQNHDLTVFFKGAVEKVEGRVLEDAQGCKQDRAGDDEGSDRIDVVCPRQAAEQQAQGEGKENEAVADRLGIEQVGL